MLRAEYRAKSLRVVFGRLCANHQVSSRVHLGEKELIGPNFFEFLVGERNEVSGKYVRINACKVQKLWNALRCFSIYGSCCAPHTRYSSRIRSAVSAWALTCGRFH